MSAVRVALVGMGRIGRDLLRILYRDEEIEIAAIDEIADPAGVEYLIRFDTILGPFPDELAIRDGNLYVAGQQIPMLASSSPADSPWDELGVDVVVAATGSARSRRELEQHLERGHHSEAGGKPAREVGHRNAAVDAASDPRPVALADHLGIEEQIPCGHRRRADCEARRE